MRSVGRRLLRSIWLDPACSIGLHIDYTCTRPLPHMLRVQELARTFAAHRLGVGEERLLRRAGE